MKHPYALWILLLAAVGGVILIAGGYNISATSGHTTVVSSILELTKRNSVYWRANSELPDDLADPAMIRRGAGHFEDGCRLCHAIPGNSIDPISEAMVPQPPPIADAVRDWSPQELFQIVKHGIKMTGMPAWPAQHRDDEIWSMVAFLQKVPNLNASDYEQIIAPDNNRASDNKPGPALLPAGLPERCAACHGWNGQDTAQGAFPLLNMQHPDYLEASLLAFRSGARPSGIMAIQVANLSDNELKLLAEHFAGKTATASAPDHDNDADHVSRLSPVENSEQWRKGKKLSESGDPKRRIPPCSACHHPADYPQRSLFPHLSGQPVAFIRQQLQLFRNGHRGGTVFAPIMQVAAKELTDGDIENLALYYGKEPSSSRQ
jgi:cytochrome c oxidase subunit 1